MSKRKSKRPPQPKPPKVAVQPVAAPRRSFAVAALALIALTTYLAYWPSHTGAQIWDDDAHITKPELQSLHGLYRIWFELDATQQYYPLLHTVFWIEHKLWGDSVLGYHLINVVWHVVAVVLLYFVLNRLKIPGALLAAAIFALHPVMVESVAWISEQKNTLSAIFYLSAMLVYLDFDESRRRSRYFIALALFVLGLLTKTVTATLPAALLVIFWWQRGTLSLKRDVLPLVPFFALGAVAGIFTAWVERTIIGAKGADFELTLIQRGLLAGRVVCFYLAKLVWPTNLIFFYPRWQIDPEVWWQWLFPLAALGVLIGLWIVRRQTRAPLAGWLLFVGTLAPVLGFLNVYPFIYSFVADHFQYLASLGMIVLASAGVGRYLNRLSKAPRALGVTLCLLALGTLAVLTFRQCRMYVDGPTLYEITLDRNPDCFMAHNNLGQYLYGLGREQEAIDHYLAALRAKPTDAPSHNNLGVALANRGQLEEAIDHYRRALRFQDNYFDAHQNLGIALTHAGRFPEAVAELQAALEISPDDPRALNSLGAALMQMGKYEEARTAIERALQRLPDYALAHNNLGLVLARTGKIPEAVQEFQRALQSDPKEINALNNLGLVRAAQGDATQAIAYYEQALRIRPDQADSHNCLAELLRQTGQFDTAIAHYREAIRLKPDYFQAYANIAKALAIANQPQDAIAAAQKAIEMARTANDQGAVEKTEEWLGQYQKELERDRANSAPMPPPAS